MHPARSNISSDRFRFVLAPSAVRRPSAPPRDQADDDGSDDSGRFAALPPDDDELGEATIEPGGWDHFDQAFDDTEPEPEDGDFWREDDSEEE